MSDKFDKLRGAFDPANSEAFARLPKWAQAEMTRLRRQWVEAEAYAEETLLKVADPETKIFLAQYERPDVPLPARSRVLFKLGNNATIEVTPSGRDNSITIRGNGFGIGALGIYPEVTNSIRVGVVPR